MKRNEIIELNGVEYTLELNRDSFLKIDQFCDTKKSMEILNRGLYKYVDEVTDETDPFASSLEIKEEEVEKEVNLKNETLHKVVERAFWIWLYPNHKLPISKVQEILKPYLEDEEKANWIGQKLGEFLQKSVEVREEYNKSKNLKAQISK